MKKQLYDELVRRAKGRGPLCYSEAAKYVGLSMDKIEDRNELSRLLGEIADHEHENGRPMLTALVVLKNSNTPSKGFYKKAKELGRFPGSKKKKVKDEFWEREIIKVCEFWSSA